MKGLVRCCALIAVISISVVGPASAGSITYTSTFSNRFPGPAIPQFDSALGELLEVQATVTGFVSGTFETIPAVTSATYNLRVGASLTSGEGGFPFASLGVANSSTPFSGGTGGLFFLGGGFTLTRELTSEFGPFVGNGQIGLSLDVSQFLTDKIPENANAFLLFASVGGTLTVTYSFAVPEPPGVIMAGTAGLLGLGCWLWRRKLLSSRQP
jgi:hypothetical protein